MLTLRERVTNACRTVIQWTPRREIQYEVSGRSPGCIMEFDKALMKHNAEHMRKAMLADSYLFKFIDQRSEIQKCYDEVQAKRTIEWNWPAKEEA